MKTLEKATAELVRLTELERENVRQASELAARISELERTAGAAILDAQLDGAEMPDVAGEIGATRRQLELAEAAADEARRRRIAAQLLVWQAEARPLRDEAAAKQREADARERKTSKLLAQLEEFEGVPYVPSRVEREAGGMARIVPIPLTDYLRQQAVELEGRALQLEQRQVAAGGEVTGYSADELIEAILAGPVVIAPDRSAIRAWVERVGQPIEQHLARRPVTDADFGKRPLYVLVWKQGRIHDRSRVELVRPDADELVTVAPGGPQRALPGEA